MRILLEHFSKSFGAVKVIEDMTLEIKDGEMLALLGPSGCGKSTTLFAICGIHRVTSGRILFGDRDVTNVPSQERNVGVVFQSYALYPHMTVADNIAFPLRRLFDYSEAEIASIVAERLARVSLPGFQERFPANLSGGQKKRVGIARATAQRAPIVLYDEPTAGLDPVNSQKIFNLIREEQRAQNSTVIVISSDVAGLLTIADRVAMLHRGELLFSGSTAQAKQSGIAAVNQFVHGLTEGPL